MKIRVLLMMAVHVALFVLTGCGDFKLDRDNAFDPEYQGPRSSLQGEVRLQKDIGAAMDHSGVIVWIDTYNATFSDTTSSDGYYEIKGIPAPGGGGNTYTVYACYRSDTDKQSVYNRLEFSVPLQAGKNEDPASLTGNGYRCLTRAAHPKDPVTFDGLTGSLEGRVVLEQSNSHVAEVSVWSPDGHRIIVRSAKDGTYRLDDVPLGKVTLEVSTDNTETADSYGYNNVYPSLTLTSENDASNPNTSLMLSENINMNTGWIGMDLLYVSSHTGASNIWRTSGDGAVRQQMTFCANGYDVFKYLLYNSRTKQVVFGIGPEDETCGNLYLSTMDVLGLMESTEQIHNRALAGKGVRLLVSGQSALNPSWDKAGGRIYYEDDSGELHKIRCIDTSGAGIPMPSGINTAGWATGDPDVNETGELVFIRSRKDPDIGIARYQICTWSESAGLKVVLSNSDTAALQRLFELDEYETDSLMVRIKDGEKIILPNDDPNDDAVVHIMTETLADQLSFLNEIRSPRWMDGDIVFVDNFWSWPEIWARYFPVSYSTDSSGYFFDADEDGVYSAGGGDVVFDPWDRRTWVDYEESQWSVSSRYCNIGFIPGDEENIVQSDDALTEEDYYYLYEQEAGGYIDRLSVSPESAISFITGSRISDESLNLTKVAGGQLWVWSGGGDGILHQITDVPGNLFPAWHEMQE